MRTDTAVCDIVSDEELEQYRTRGFVYLRNVLPPSLLDDIQRIMEPVVDYLIDGWRHGGQIQSSYSDLDFWQRLLEAWRAAGQPPFRRRPYRFLINPEMYALFKRPELLAIAECVLGTSEINVHGLFNGRPQLPGAPWLETPWHQDAQYWNLDYGQVEPDKERRTHVVTMWIPLQAVTEKSGALKFMSKIDTKDQMFEPHEFDFKNTGFLGLGPDDVTRFPHHYESMERGDLVIFDQRTPHGANLNKSNAIRWSIDIRYEATATATVVGKKFGFVAQSKENPASETSLEEWITKRQGP
jgi:hypothetical protein